MVLAKSTGPNEWTIKTVLDNINNNIQSQELQAKPTVLRIDTVCKLMTFH